MAEFKVGSKVQIKAFSQMPEEQKGRGGLGKLCGKTATVWDRQYSERESAYTYTLIIDGYDKPSSVAFTAQMIEEVATADYECKVIIEGGVAIIRLYKNGTEVRYNHAHIFHPDEAGVAQAISFAAKRLFLSYDENAKSYISNHAGDGNCEMRFGAL